MHNKQKENHLVMYFLVLSIIEQSFWKDAGFKANSLAPIFKKACYYFRVSSEL